MDWQTNEPRLIGDGARNRPANPPDRIGAKSVAAPVVETVYGAHKADGALLHEVFYRHTVSKIATCYRSHKAKIGQHQALFCLPLQLLISGLTCRLNLASKLDLLLMGKQSHLPGTS